MYQKSLPANYSTSYDGSNVGSFFRVFLSQHYLSACLSLYFCPGSSLIFFCRFAHELLFRVRIKKKFQYMKWHWLSPSIAGCVFLLATFNRTHQRNLASLVATSTVYLSAVKVTRNDYTENTFLGV